MTAPRGRRPPVERWRNAVLFIGGIAGVFYETVFQSSDRPYLLVLFGAMMGLPAFLDTDVRVRRRNDDDEDA